MNEAVPKLFFPLADDWSYERPSNSYFLGDIINIEASVKVYNHVPLRVFVDRCVATQVPDVNALPRYLFIENHGCVHVTRCCRVYFLSLLLVTTLSPRTIFVPSP